MIPNTGTSSEFERVFLAMVQEGTDAVLVSGEGDLYAHRELIVQLAEKHRLPTMCPYRDYVDAGGLMGAWQVTCIKSSAGRHRVTFPSISRLSLSC